MKTLRTLAAVLAMLSTPAAFAGAGHDLTPKHGGVAAEASGVVYELVATPAALTLHLDDHGQRINTDGATAKITLLAGAEKTEAILTPAGDNKLEAKGTYKLTSGTKAVAVVTLAGKAPATARFAIK
ncbi:hypothetical protein [Aromatoleum evansii]|uniref:hypothetical protein n=1 Tax=Aromatoleum evansii TaxID=59406 RepID=UPI00145F8D68|nr:hypothetical protein [Aromatoleum evansii]NMG29981.1 hypothetical protein [Aromatoleum evansii]